MLYVTHPVTLKPTGYKIGKLNRVIGENIGCRLLLLLFSPPPYKYKGEKCIFSKRKDENPLECLEFFRESYVILGLPCQFFTCRWGTLFSVP